MKYSFLAIIAILFMSCNNDDSNKGIDYTEKNETEIKQYIADNDLETTRTESGLYYVINEEGTGKQPTASSNVTVAYKGYYTSGKVFDESDAEGVSFPLQQVIKGWTEGMQFFKEGGSGILLIPSHLGYGSYFKNGIPGGSVLIFEVKLISVN